MAISFIIQRTATKGTGASGASVVITIPTGTVVGDVLLVGFSNAGTAGPSAPTGWQIIASGVSAGTAQSLSVYCSLYSPALTLTFTNAASVAAWTCNAFTGCVSFMGLNQSSSNLSGPIDAHANATNATNNTTLPVGNPTTGKAFGDYEVLFYGWTSAATITTPAAGTTIDATQANSTSVSCAIGHNNTTNIAASTTLALGNATLSASNTRKAGIGVLLRARIPIKNSIGHPFIY